MRPSRVLIFSTKVRNRLGLLVSNFPKYTHTTLEPEVIFNGTSKTEKGSSCEQYRKQ